MSGTGAGVLGVGLDLVDIGSFADQLAVPGSSIAGATFTSAELAEAESVQRERPDDEHAAARRLAGRFAAKEAFLKAWSSARIGRAPALADLRWQDLEVLNDPWGRPFLRPTGETAAAVIDSVGAIELHVSITHDGPVAAAVVVITGNASASGGNP